MEMKATAEVTVTIEELVELLNEKMDKKYRMKITGIKPIYSGAYRDSLFNGIKLIGKLNI